MTKSIYQIAGAAALIAMAAPASAGPREIPFDTSDRYRGAQTYMFSGGTVRLALDRRGEHRPEIALQLAGGIKTDGGVRRIGQGIAFGTVARDRPRLTLNGYDSRAIEKRLSMSDGAKAALIIGGLVVVAGIVVIATTSPFKDGEPFFE